MSTIKENLFYTEEHEWLDIEGNIATIGITDFAQSSLGDIVFVELPDADQSYDAGDSFGVVESIKSVSDLYTPISGKIIEKNLEIEESPEKINENAFAAWLVKVEISDEEELKKLMDATAYTTFCQENA